jgi:pSer/pThr/pTyr-binding forkhead associated (FHA) protein
VTFGNGVSWDDYCTDPGLTLQGIRSLANWFLLLRPRQAAPEPVELGDDPTGNTDVDLPRTPTGSFTGAASSSSQYVFRIARKPRAQFDFVSVGRNENNDLYLPDNSVSRFHAFFREAPDGSLLLQDARSSNGTRCRDLVVPAQGAGPPIVVASGDPVRFGDIHGVALSASSLYDVAMLEARKRRIP